MELNEWQKIIGKIYFAKDSARGLDKTFNWLIEEIGEMARAIRRGDKRKISEEFADCLAWLLSVGSILGVEAESAMAKYAKGCPKCQKMPCGCKEKYLPDVS